MQADRRTFLKKTLLATGAALSGAGVVKAVETAARAAPAGPKVAALLADGTIVHVDASQAVAGNMLPAADPTGRAGVPGRRWIMVIDLAKCDGCGRCTQACGKMHFIPDDPPYHRQYIPVMVMHDAKLAAPYYFPRPCFHCDVPPCTKVCPVNATYKTEDGTVLIDNDRCIGCRFCMAACPYGARSFNWGPPANSAAEDGPHGYSPEWGYPRKIGTVEKCDFCPEHAAMGMLPACASGCPMRAIYYGDENEDAVTNSAGETMRLSKLLLDRAGYRHMEGLGTQPRVYYLPPVNRLYPAPPMPARESAEEKPE